MPSDGVMTQAPVFEHAPHKYITPFRKQLLKWIGNKQRFAHEIVGAFPDGFNRYFEPFLGSGAVLATLSPKDGFGSDTFSPLIEIFGAVKSDPDRVKVWYRERWEMAHGEKKREGYERVKAAYNSQPNGPDLLFLCRACYGGVVRFRKSDGYMSTPCGAHEPMQPARFDEHVDMWHQRLRRSDFALMHYVDAMRRARRGDLVYCDPPYSHSQSILYGGQDFRLADLLEEIGRCKARGVYVALSIDGTKKSGATICDVPVPDGLFEEEVFVNVGRSMLRRFQMEGRTLEDEVVADRLLLTYAQA